MKIRKRFLAMLFTACMAASMSQAQQTNFFDDFNDGARSNMWVVYGNTATPAVLQEANGVLKAQPRGVDDDGTLGYFTPQRFPWNDSGTSYVYTLWLSNITATVTSRVNSFSVRSVLSLLTETNKHFLATNALSMFSEYWPESNTLCLAVMSKTNKYYWGSPWGGTGDSHFRGYITNVSSWWAQGALRLSLELRSGVYHVRAHSASGQEIFTTGGTGASSGNHGLTNLYNAHVMLVVDNESASAPYGKGYALFDKIQRTEQDTAIPNVLLQDDFSDQARYNFWTNTSNWKLSESNGVLNAFQMSGNTDDNAEYYLTARPLPITPTEKAYVFKAALSNIHVDAGTGMKAVLFASRDQSDPWISTNNIYFLGDYTEASDELVTKLMIERDGGFQYGDLRFYGVVTGFSHYVAAGGLEAELTLSNGLYSLALLDAARQQVPFQSVSGSLVGVHYLDTLLTNLYWGLGVANSGISTGRVEWAGTCITQMTSRVDLRHTMWDEFSGGEKGSWWNFLVDSFIPFMSQADGYLIVNPGFQDDRRSAYVARDPVTWSGSSTGYWFQASLSTVTLTAASDDPDTDLRGLFYLTPNPSNDYWVSPVALSLFTEYRDSDHRLVLKLYTKTNITSSFGTLLFSGTIADYQQFLTHGPLTMSLKLHGDYYALDLQDGAGNPVPLSSETGYRCGLHALGDQLGTAYWAVGAQNVSIGRGQLYWADAFSWQEYSVGSDVNANGLPDWWEQQYFGSPTGANPALDSDGDGQNNQEEFLALTDPTTNASLFEAQGVGKATGSGPEVRISWLGMAGRLYNVEVAEGSISNDMSFAPLSGAQGLSPSASNQLLSVSDADVADKPEKTYRINVQAP